MIRTDSSMQYIVYNLKAYFKIVDRHDSCCFLSSNQSYAYKKTVVWYGDSM